MYTDNMSFCYRGLTRKSDFVILWSKQSCGAKENLDINMSTPPNLIYELGTISHTRHAGIMFE